MTNYRAKAGGTGVRETFSRDVSTRSCQRSSVKLSLYQAGLGQAGAISVLTINLAYTVHLALEIP